MKPLFVTSRKRVIAQYKKLTNLGCTVSYSHKTNRTVWRVLEQSTDSQVHVHNLAGVIDIQDPSRIWYFTLAIDNELLDTLVSKGVVRFVVDNPADLNTLITYINNNNLPINLMLRMKIRENTIFTGKYYVYGMTVKEVRKHIHMLRQNPNIKRLGIHFHRKTQNVSEWSLKEEMADAIDPDTLQIIDILDIGGGIPGMYKSSHDHALQRIFVKISELRAWLPDHIELMVEPGRFIAGPSTHLTCNIIAKHDNTLFVNCSIFNGVMDTIVANVKLIVKGELSEDQGRPYTIKGCTPDSMDILRYKVNLEKPKVGDTITFLNAGAYTYSTDFMNLPKIENIISD